MTKYYHITNPSNKDSILKDGLKCNEEGEIFLFENKSIKIDNSIHYVSDLIAKNQIFLTEYAMFEIDLKGIEQPLINDNVAETSSSLQWIAKQPIIKLEHINFFGYYKTEIKG